MCTCESEQSDYCLASCCIPSSISCIVFHSCRAIEWPFWFGFILPFAALYVFDWIMFIIILASVIKQRRASVKVRQDSSFKTHRENLTISLSLAIVFGLGWGFGLLSTSHSAEDVTITFQVLFSIFVGAQGILLFLLHGVRNPDARKTWKGWLTSTSRLSHGMSSSTHKTAAVKTPQSITYTNTSSGATSQTHKVDLSRPSHVDTSASASQFEETKIDLSASITTPYKPAVKKEDTPLDNFGEGLCIDYEMTEKHE